MSNSINLISNIEEKVITLLTRLEVEKKEKGVLQDNLVELHNLIKEKDLIINTLEKEVLHNNQSLESGERVEVMNKLNDILRDIDQCLGELQP